ncbi:two-component system, OmpR family, sensor histidine kinase VicK [Caldanaerobius fijiensis DSM 17918]|uniref:histidine kinase n=1 Tax=Caldanaerobius fijiensis DSM 17918 TaxID=1121256 RepID=A0A1M4X9B2_9THEO|nr:ATP-binding protein [Caldanaerobius fijiensis]SHE90110.1 two-component system, OmpR family, sensor histidine kinase VicK [Caldanaerobius fijiensis DSM 17918]
MKKRYKAIYKSLQWKLVVMYLMLILLAMEIVGVYLINSFQDYQIKNLSNYLEYQAKSLSFTLKDNIKEQANIKTILYLYISPDSQLKYIYVLDREGRIIQGTDYRSGKIISPLVFQALSDSKNVHPITDSKKRIMEYAYPIKSSTGQIEGIVYIGASMDNILKTINDVKVILFSATIIAVLITIVLGFILARTITEPIKDITNKAEALANGDFDQIIKVRADDEIGQLAGMFNYLTSRLRQTLSEIASEKSKAEGILMNMSDGVIAASRDGTIQVVNDAAKIMLSDYQISVGDNVFDIVKKLTGEEVGFESLIENNKMVFKTSKGIFNAHFAQFKGGKDEVEGFVMVVHDITEQQRLDNMRKQFVADVSHELRTPLTTIKSYVETLMGDDIGEDARKQFLHVVDKEVDRMVRLVKDLLLLSNLDNNRYALKKQRIDLKNALIDIISNMKMLAREKSQEIYVKFCDDDITVEGDPDKLEQVFINVINNAIKYTPDNGKIEIEVSVVKNMVLITVSDNGIGIPEDDIDKVFERFYRVDKARSRELGGTGLGLSISKEIVNAHNGKIEIESALNQGTSVYIYLPLS